MSALHIKLHLANLVLAMLLILACIMTHHCIVSSIYMCVCVCAYDHILVFQLKHTYVSHAQSYLGGSDQGLIEPNSTLWQRCSNNYFSPETIKIEPNLQSKLTPYFMRWAKRQMIYSLHFSFQRLIVRIMILSKPNLMNTS